MFEDQSTVNEPMAYIQLKKKKMTMITNYSLYLKQRKITLCGWWHSAGISKTQVALKADCMTALDCTV